MSHYMVTPGQLFQLWLLRLRLFSWLCFVRLCFQPRRRWDPSPPTSCTPDCSSHLWSPRSVVGLQFYLLSDVAQVNRSLRRATQWGYSRVWLWLVFTWSYTRTWAVQNIRGCQAFRGRRFTTACKGHRSVARLLDCSLLIRLPHTLF